MTNFKIFSKQRRLKQLFMGAFFILVLIGGWIYPILGFFIPVCMVLGIGIALFKGRKWCDWYCPRGSFSDSMVKPISPNKEIPAFFKGLPFRIGVLSFLMIMMAAQIIRRWPDPNKIGMFFVILLTVTTLIGIILSLIFHQRTWCCFCPIGSMANWIGRWKYPLKIGSSLCDECKVCYKVCPIQVAPYSATNRGGSANLFGGKFKKIGLETIKDGDCLKCRSCVNACPKGALGF